MAGAERVARAPGDELFARYDQQESDASGPLRAAGALLRAPGPLLRDIGAERRVALHAASLLAVAVGFCAIYGAVLGLYQPGWQTLWAALKLPIIVVGSALLCTPTLYVFNALCGSRLTYLQTVAIVLMMAGSLSLVLVAFAPIVWFFGVSTEGFAFMTILHVAAFAVAVGVGLHGLGVTRRYLAYLNGAEVVGQALLVLWSFLVVLVGLQMAHYMRPLLLTGPFHTGQRGLFIEFLGTLF